MGRLVATLLLLSCGGCVERTLAIRSDPPHALVFLNDQEIGRTPLTHKFLWYGFYDVQVRKEGYQRLKTTSPVIAPWWQWAPLDFLAEVAPIRLHDVHELSYSLRPQAPTASNPDALVQRGQGLREQLKSSEFTKTLPTQPTTRPAHRKPQTRPAR